MEIRIQSIKFNADQKLLDFIEKKFSRIEKFYDAMSERLSGLLLEMRNPEFPFARTKDEKVCAYCDFRTICGR